MEHVDQNIPFPASKEDVRKILKSALQGLNEATGTYNDPSQLGESLFGSKEAAQEADVGFELEKAMINEVRPFRGIDTQKDQKTVHVCYIHHTGSRFPPRISMSRIHCLRR